MPDTQPEPQTLTGTDADAATGDGRHARRNANRDRIVHAFLDLVREGAVEPGAHAVAGRAGVSPRTVFRCFQDMEALYRELTVALRAEFLPRAVLDLNTPDRRERLERLLANRVALFSDMEPFRFASRGYRHRYASLQDDDDFLVGMERERLQIVLNPDRRLDPDLFEALDATTSFDVWCRLRIGQRLDRDAAARAYLAAARAVYAAAPDPGPVSDDGGVR